MSMIIAVCDDDKVWLEEAKGVIERYADQSLLEVEILCFSDGEQLLAYTGEDIEVLFLDIELGKENGIQLGKRVNRRWEQCQIVYLTNYLYYATDVYLTAHVFFVLKEQYQEKIKLIFTKIFHNIQQRKKMLVFTEVGGNQLVVAPEEVLYFEHKVRTTWLYTTAGNYEITGKIIDIVKKLPKIDFSRCHNSYIVYLPSVREVKKEGFVLRNDTVIFFSKRYKKKAKADFLRWALTQMI